MQCPNVTILYDIVKIWNSVKDILFRNTHKVYNQQAMAIFEEQK